MAVKRAPYAKRSVWYLVIGLAAIVVIGFAVTGYEIIHLRHQVDGLRTVVDTMNNTVTLLYTEVAKLLAHATP